MKKIRIFVMALAITFCSAVPTYATLPFNSENGMIVMGNRAYSLSYLSSLSSPSDIRAINDRVAKYTNTMYYVYTNDNYNEKIINTTNLNGSSYTEANLSYNYGNTMTYQGVNGQRTYVYDSTTMQYKDQESNAYANAYVNIQNISNVYLADIRIEAGSILGLTGVAPSYYKLEHSSEIKTIGSDINCILRNTSGTERVYLLSSDKTTIATGDLNISPSNGYTYRKFYLSLQQSTDTNNIAHNISNNGYAAQDNLWIYYSNTSDGGKLYKIKKDGQDNQPISNDKVAFINVGGSVIYYSNLSDGSKIYKINNDGTGRAKVCDDMATYTFLSGNTIYYSNHSKAGSLSKVDIQNTGGAGQVLSSDDAAFINVSGNTIYYSNNSDGKKIYSIGTDGLCRTCISTEGASYINLLDSYIIYGNYSHGGCIYKIKKDGTEDGQIGSGKTAKAINVHGNNDLNSVIYFSNLSDGGKLYKMNIDGSNITGPLIKDVVDAINITDNGIYYSKSNKLSLASPLGGSTMTTSQVTKAQFSDKIQTLNNISDTILNDKELDNYQFPDRVPAIMSTGVTKEIVVNWDFSKVVKKNNSYTYSGTLLGYGNKVTLTLTVTASTPIAPENVTITNNSGRNYKVVVIGLSSGDTIKIYSNQTSDTPIDNGNGIVVVGTDSTVASTNINVPESLTSVSISLTKAPTTGMPTPSESSRIDVALPVSTAANFNSNDVTITNNNGANDVVSILNSNIPVGDTFKIYRKGETQPFKTLISTMTGTITFESLDLGAKAGSLDITETSPGKAESGRITKTYNASLNQSDITKALDYVVSEFKESSGVNPETSGTYAGRYILKNNFTLPSVILQSRHTELKGDVSVTWKSSNTSLISIVGNNAIILRPLTDQNLILYAELSQGDAHTDTDVSFNITVSEVAMDEAVDIDAKLITIGYVNEGDTSTNVTGNLILPTIGQNGSTISWTATPETGKSNPVSFANMTNTGIATVTQPQKGAGDVKVRLTATTSKAGTAHTGTPVNFDIVVKEKSATQDDLNTALTLISDLSSPLTINYGEDAFKALKLDMISSMGVGISMQSSDPNTIRLGSDQSGNLNSATIINPLTYAQGPENVTLNITLTKNGKTASKSIVVRIMNKPATDGEFANAISDALSAYLITMGNKNPLNELYLPLSSYDVPGYNGFNFRVSPSYSLDTNYIKGSSDKVLKIKWTSDINTVLNNSDVATTIEDQIENGSTNHVDVSNVPSGTKVTLTGEIVDSDGNIIINKIIIITITH